VSENNFGFDKILHRKLKYLDELEERLLEKEDDLNAEREELYRQREEFICLQNKRFADLPPADLMQKKAYENAYALLKSMNLNTSQTSGETKNLHLSESDMNRIIGEFDKLKELLHENRNLEKQQFDDLRREIRNQSIEVLNLLKNPPSQGISVMQILPRAGMVLMPLIMRFMKTDEDHQILKEMQDEIRKFVKEQENAEDTKA